MQQLPPNRGSGGSSSLNTISSKFGKLKYPWGSSLQSFYPNMCSKTIISKSHGWHSTAGFNRLNRTIDSLFCCGGECVACLVCATSTVSVIVAECLQTNTTWDDDPSVPDIPVNLAQQYFDLLT